jgi:hypothetical protein
VRSHFPHLAEGIKVVRLHPTQSKMPHLGRPHSSGVLLNTAYQWHVRYPNCQQTNLQEGISRRQVEGAS